MLPALRTFLIAGAMIINNSSSLNRIEHDRQITRALAGCVEYGVGRCRAGRDARDRRRFNFELLSEQTILVHRGAGVI